VDHTIDEETVTGGACGCWWWSTWSKAWSMWSEAVGAVINGVLTSK